VFYQGAVNKTPLRTFNCSLQASAPRTRLRVPSLVVPATLKPGNSILSDASFSGQLLLRPLLCTVCLNKGSRRAYIQARAHDRLPFSSGSLSASFLYDFILASLVSSSTSKRQQARENKNRAFTTCCRPGEPASRAAGGHNLTEVASICNPFCQKTAKKSLDVIVQLAGVFVFTEFR
jgi:hypothetical protein